MIGYCGKSDNPGNPTYKAMLLGITLKAYSVAKAFYAARGRGGLSKLVPIDRRNIFHKAMLHARMQMKVQCTDLISILLDMCRSGRFSASPEWCVRYMGHGMCAARAQACFKIMAQPTAITRADVAFLFFDVNTTWERFQYKKWCRSYRSEASTWAKTMALHEKSTKKKDAHDQDDDSDVIQQLRHEFAPELQSEHSQNPSDSCDTTDDDASSVSESDMESDAESEATSEGTQSDNYKASNDNATHVHDSDNEFSAMCDDIHAVMNEHYQQATDQPTSCLPRKPAPADSPRTHSPNERQHQVLHSNTSSAELQVKNKRRRRQLDISSYSDSDDDALPRSHRIQVQQVNSDVLIARANDRRRRFKKGRLLKIRYSSD